MTSLREIGSREARKEWREILDNVMTGDSDVLISRHGQEIAVLIPARDYHAILDELEDIRLARLTENIYENYLEGRASSRLYEEARAEGSLVGVDDAFASQVDHFIEEYRVALDELARAP